MADDNIDNIQLQDLQALAEKLGILIEIEDDDTDSQDETEENLPTQPVEEKVTETPPTSEPENINPPEEELPANPPEEELPANPPEEKLPANPPKLTRQPAMFFNQPPTAPRYVHPVFRFQRPQKQ